jgi:hypothetical protein
MLKMLPIKVPAGAVFFLVLLCVLMGMSSCTSSVDYERKYPRMVANADPISAGTIEAEFDQTFSPKLKSVQIEVIFHPRLNAVSLEFRFDLLRYRQFWDDDARRQFTTALKIYKEDYAARNFIDRHRKTRAVYGKAKGQVEWETFKFSRIRTAYPVIELGYRFRNKMPFFACHMPSTQEVMGERDYSQEQSHQITMYFTRAQADELVKLFDESYLMELLKKPASPEPVPSESTPESSYREWGDQ